MRLMADTAQKHGYHFEAVAADVWECWREGEEKGRAAAVAFKSTEFTTCWNFYAF